MLLWFRTRHGDVDPPGARRGSQVILRVGSRACSQLLFTATAYNLCRSVYCHSMYDKRPRRARRLPRVFGAGKNWGWDNSGVDAPMGLRGSVAGGFLMGVRV